MKLSAKEIARLLNGTIEGEEAVIITHPGKIEAAEKGAITFLANQKYESFIYTTKAAVVLVSNDFQPKKKVHVTLIRVENVYVSITKILQIYEDSFHPSSGISSLAFIHNEAQIGQSASIGDFTYISAKVQIGDNCRIYPQVFIGKGTSIGKNVIIYPGVKIYHNCRIGDNCILQANAVIGSDGFGFAPQVDGTFQKIPQVGNVIIEDNVEIGANTVIDRATTGSTLIEAGTKLDNLIQIAHNVTVGSHTVIAAQAGIAGSTRIGNHCQIGGQAGFVGHIEIADKVKVQAQSGVTKSVEKEGTALYGYPAISYRDYLKSYTLFRQLPDLEKRIRQIEKEIK